MVLESFVFGWMSTLVSVQFGLPGAICEIRSFLNVSEAYSPVALTAAARSAIHIVAGLSLY